MNAGGRTKLADLLEGLGGIFLFTDFSYGSNTVCAIVIKEFV